MYICLFLFCVTCYGLAIARFVSSLPDFHKASAARQVGFVLGTILAPLVVAVELAALVVVGVLAIALLTVSLAAYAVGYGAGLLLSGPVNAFRNGYHAAAR